MPFSHLLVSLATLALMVLFTVTLALLFLAWRTSAAIQGYQETCRHRARTEERVVHLLQEFLEEQRRTHEQFWLSLQVQGDRLSRLMERELAEGE